MRYPGPYYKEAKFKRYALIGALFLFSMSAFVASHKLNPAINADQLQPFIRISPSPTSNIARLQIFNRQTLAPLANTSIQLRVESFCTLEAPCQVASPEVYTTDVNGMIITPLETAQNGPIFAVESFVKDAYYAFLKSDQPFEITLYNAPNDLKRTYDIRHEIIPIYLQPL